MSEYVFTTKGDVPRSELRFEERTHENDDEVIVERVWFHLDDTEPCRRDGWVTKKRAGWEAAAGNFPSR